jgi:type II secretory pathway component GspD/PulD (secretin)
MRRSLVGVLALVLGIGVCGAWGHEPVKPPAARKAEGAAGAAYKRFVYVVKHGTSKSLAETLGKHFKGADVEVQTVPQGPDNVLLIRAPAAVFGEVVQLLEQLDRRPRMVAVQVLVAEVTPKGAEDVQKEIDERQLSGTMNDVQARLNTLIKGGVVTGVKRVQLTAVEGQPNRVLLGENRPFVAGVHTTTTGLVSRSIMYRNTGLSVTVTPRVSPDGTIRLDLRLEDSRPHVPADGIPIGQDEKGPVRATEFVTSTLETQLALTPGQAVPVRDVKTTSRSGRERTLVVVSGQVVEPGADWVAQPPEKSTPGRPRRPMRRDETPP